MVWSLTSSDFSKRSWFFLHPRRPRSSRLQGDSSFPFILAKRGAYAGRQGISRERRYLPHHCKQNSCQSDELIFRIWSRPSKCSQVKTIWYTAKMGETFFHELWWFQILFHNYIKIMAWKFFFPVGEDKSRTRISEPLPSTCKLQITWLKPYHFARPQFINYSW